MNNIYKYEYRAKRLTNNKWAYGYMLVNSAGKYCLNGACQFEDNSENPVYIDKNTIGRYAKFRDINKKDVYEGDIVEWTFFYYERINGGLTYSDTIVTGIIKYKDGEFIFVPIRNNFQKVDYYVIDDLETDTESDAEVIGNIYDNPELINNKNEK